MGKGGRGGGGKKQPKQALAADDDAALLDAAIAQAAAERAQMKQQPPAPAPPSSRARNALADKSKAGSVLSMPDTLAKMDRVMAFTVARLLPDGSKDVCPSSDGSVTFYTDAADVNADLAELKAAHPDAKLGVDFTPLGRAFALSQGLMGLKPPCPMRIQFSRRVVQEVGEAGVPADLRSRMAGAGPFPLFFSERLGSEAFTPVFFTRADLNEFWANTGGAYEKAPEPTVTDLRIVVARTLQEPGQWEPLHYIPPKASEALTKELASKADREAAVTQGFAAGTQRLKAVAKAVAVENGDEPPPLA